MLHPAGLTRALSRSVSELMRDRFQATARDPPRRAAALQPRPGRPRCCAAVTNGALRDLNTILVAQHMLRGHPVDLRRLRRLRRDRAPRRHPPSREPGGARGGRRRPAPAGAGGDRGAAAVPVRDPLRPRPGPGDDRSRTGTARTWPSLVARLARSRRRRLRRRRRGLGPDPGAGRRAGLRPAASAGAACRARRRRWTSATATSPTRHAGTSAGRPTPARDDRGPAATGDETFHVFGSGNLGLVYVRGEKERLDPPRAATRGSPDSCDGLGQPSRGRLRRRDRRRRTGRPGQPRAGTGSTTATSRASTRCCRSGPYAPEFVKRAAHRPEAPDIYVNSLRRPRHRGGRGVRGPGRLPRRPRRLAGPRLRRRAPRPAVPRRASRRRRRHARRAARRSCATSGTAATSPNPTRQPPADSRLLPGSSRRLWPREPPGPSGRVRAVHAVRAMPRPRRRGVMSRGRVAPPLEGRQHHD